MSSVGFQGMESRVTLKPAVVVHTFHVLHLERNNIMAKMEGEREAGTVEGT